MFNRVRELNGYRVIFKPEHPKAMKNENWLGWVYEHTYFAEEALGRSLAEDEIVHHLNCDRADNRITNLLVMSRSQHLKLHAWLDMGAPICESYRMSRVNSEKSNVDQIKYCLICGITLQGQQENCCSNECYAISQRRVERPTKEQLEEELKTTSMRALGRKYGVSDNAVRKWAKQYELL